MSTHADQSSGTGCADGMVMLHSQEGIHSVKVALLAERGVVEYDPEKWDSDKLISVCVLLSALAVLLILFTGNIRHWL